MPPTTYRLDASNRIVEVNSQFWGFAEDCGASLAERQILGANVFDFIADKETVKVYDILYRYVRSSHQPVRFPYRCDSPGLQRTIEMSISSLPKQGLCVVNRTMNETKRDEVVPMSFTHSGLLGENTKLFVYFCSFCNLATLPGGEWEELPKLLNRVFRQIADQQPIMLCQPCQPCVVKLSKTVEQSLQSQSECLGRTAQASRHAIEARQQLRRIKAGVVSSVPR